MVSSCHNAREFLEDFDALLRSDVPRQELGVYIGISEKTTVGRIFRDVDTFRTFLRKLTMFHPQYVFTDGDALMFHRQNSTLEGMYKYAVARSDEVMEN